MRSRYEARPTPEHSVEPVRHHALANDLIRCYSPSNRFDDERMNMATIEDVARAAGVSRSTVSYALSGKRTISQETRTRIERAIAELGFTVNAGARALATAQTMTLGLLS